MRRALVVLVLQLGLGGCGLLGMERMSPEQIAAAAKVKDANVVCVIGNTAWGRVQSTYVTLDKGVMVNGAIAVDDSCKVQLTTSAPPREPAPPAPPANAQAPPR